MGKGPCVRHSADFECEEEEEMIDYLLREWKGEPGEKGMEWWGDGEQ
jgi:hypothetical protein